MEVNGHLHTLAALPPGEEPWYPLKRRLGGTHSWSGCGNEEKNSMLLLKSNHSCPAHSLVTILTGLVSQTANQQLQGAGSSSKS